MGQRRIGQGSLAEALLLAQWYRHSDPGLEEALADRLPFRRFCGFGLNDGTPDETALCRFRGTLAASGLAEALLAEPNRQLDARGLVLKAGTLIDATLVEAAVARPPQTAPSTASCVAAMRAARWSPGSAG